MSAYQRMAKMYHPDKVATLGKEFRDLAESKMKEINHAYEILKSTSNVF
jgi:DnaJ like chaperone protein